MTKDEAFSTERALKLALEVLEIQAYNSGDEKYTQAMTALKEALVQPEQEPVAWDGYNLYGICEAFDRVIEEHHQRKNPFHDPVNKDAMIALRVLRGFVPYMNLYTTPPAAPVQPMALTGEQRIYLAQAWAMLEDYAQDQRSHGNDSFADGAEASAHEIKTMLTALPAAQRKPLTDEQHEQMMRGRSTLDYGRAVEAKLKEHS